MGRLASFLEGFSKDTMVQLISKNDKVIFEGPKDDIPHRFEDQVNIFLGSVKILENYYVSIKINYDDEA